MKRAIGLLLILAAAGTVWAVRERVWSGSPRLSAGDFPAGVSAPLDEVASVPLRPTRIGYLPRGAVAGLVWAANEGQTFKDAYALEVKGVSFEREDALGRALIKGGDSGGVDLAAMGVWQLALEGQFLRDAAPRTVLLLGRSRGDDVLAAGKGITHLAGLKGKRIGAVPSSSGAYFLLWVLSRAGLSIDEVSWVDLQSASEAGKELTAGKIDAAAGNRGDLESAVKQLGGSLLSSTVDAPHLMATVLVVRGDFAARYPDAVRRILRGVLDANASVAREVGPAARVLGDLAPWLGDPTEAIKYSPPASVRDNLAFFGLSGAAPVTYFELFKSASALGTRLWNNPPTARAEDTCDLGALKYVSTTRGP